MGATTILHFLNPRVFIIVDSNARPAFQKAHGIPRAYTSENYVKRLEHAQRHVLEFGLDAFCALEDRVPLTRIYDKLTFVTGAPPKQRPK